MLLDQQMLMNSRFWTNEAGRTGIYLDCRSAFTVATANESQ
jgi:hypothetical protein